MNPLGMLETIAANHTKRLNKKGGLKPPFLFIA